MLEVPVALAVAVLLGLYSAYELARARRPAVVSTPFRWRIRGEAAIPLGLFALAVAVRWWGLPAQARGMWGDEAQLMVEANKFIQGVYTSPFIIDHLSLPALYEYVMSVPLRVAGGTNVTAARAYSGVLGALSVPLLYATARELGYPRRVGFVAGVALATTFWDVNFSRLVLPNIMAVTATSATILLTAMAVRRSSLALAALAGLALAWAFNAHLSGMIISPLVAGWLALLLVGHSRWWERKANVAGAHPRHAPPAPASPTALGLLAARRNWLARGRTTAPSPPLDLDRADARPRIRAVLAVGAVLAGSALVCAWPLLQLYFAPGSPLQGHAAERFVLSPENRAYFATAHPDIGSGVPGILWYQFKAAAGLFTVRGDPVAVFDDNSRPMLDPLNGLLFIAGIAGALWRWRRPATTLVLLWLVVPITLGTMLTIGSLPGVDSPSITRSIPAAPAMCLLIALGLETILIAARTLLGRVVPRSNASTWWPSVCLSATVVAAGLTGALGIERYWEFANASVTRNAFSNGAHEWATFLAPRGPIPVTVVAPAGWPVEYNGLFAPAALLCTGRWNATWTACPPARVVIFDNDQTEAYRYGQVTRLPVHEGQPDYDGVVRYWYVEGQRLPDPARVLGGIR